MICRFWKSIISLQPGQERANLLAQLKQYFIYEVNDISLWLHTKNRSLSICSLHLGQELESGLSSQEPGATEWVGLVAQESLRTEWVGGSITRASQGSESNVCVFGTSDIFENGVWGG